MKRLLSLSLVILFALSACSSGLTAPDVVTNPPSAQDTQPPATATDFPTFTPLPADTQAAPATPAPTDTQPQPQPTAPSGGLTLDQLRSATLNIMGADQNLHSIQLQDGKFQQGTDPAQPGYISVTLGDKVAFGDLNGDGLTDAAITLAENYGGTGTFISVYAIIDQNGQPANLASALIDDRALINNLGIQDGEIMLDATVHGPNDPMCCPGQPTKRNYRLLDNSLVIDSLSTTTENGVERAITVDSPGNGSAISGPFIIKGSVTVSPFENTLSYQVFVKGSNNPVNKASFQVSGDGLGGPGTFELPIDPAKMQLSGSVRIEIDDLSAADGSVLEARSVFVTIQ